MKRHCERAGGEAGGWRGGDGGGSRNGWRLHPAVFRSAWKRTLGVHDAAQLSSNHFVLLVHQFEELLLVRHCAGAIDDR